MKKIIKLTFSDYFEVSKKKLQDEGFFDISLLSDLPLFIDPFLLFYSQKKEYQKLHKDIIDYLIFLRQESIARGKNPLNNGDMLAYYKFPEIKQNWLGFTFGSNEGHGLGVKFARALNVNFTRLFKDFGVGTHNHFEKLTLISGGVGKDTISDFTTNLIVGFLAEKTEEFAKKYLPKEKLGMRLIRKYSFDYKTKTWVPKSFLLPIHKGDYVLLTPRDLLTKHETWINKTDFFESFSDIPNAIPDVSLRHQLSSYFNQKLKEYAVRKINPKTKKETLSFSNETHNKAVLATTSAYPEVIDVYIKLKEKTGERAVGISEELVAETEHILEEQFRSYVEVVGVEKRPPTSLEEAYSRAMYFKHCVEERGCYRYFYNNGKPVSEDWAQGMFWFTLFGTESAVTREPDVGPGNPDWHFSQGRRDKSLAEFKLAKSKTFESNLLKQLEKYKKAESTKKGIWVIIFYSSKEEDKVRAILKKYKLEDDRSYILVDARNDNKISASKIKM